MAATTNCGVRTVVQQVESAELSLDAGATQWGAIERGIIVYVCFLKSATTESVHRAVEAISSAQICFNPVTNGNESIIAVKGDVMIIPQASMAGKLKSNVAQYHSLIEKQSGLRLFNEFISSFSSSISAQSHICATTPATPSPKPTSSSEPIIETTTTSSETTASTSSTSEPQAAATTTTTAAATTELHHPPAKTVVLVSGTYGNRQRLRMTSSGPYTHIFDF
ncbi:D-aminoacyl-tRNA deacylase 2 [Pelomyxa schiedti]|nr:D-aminoacyl-tRNA deacylase 2 [Pelomyxa schiedti]